MGEKYLFILFHIFPGGSDGKESACNGVDPSLIPGSGILPEEETGYPLWYSFTWIIPWTEDPGGIQSTDSQRVTYILDKLPVQDF